MYIPEKTILQEVMMTYFNVEASDLDDLIHWIRGPVSASLSQDKISQFRAELREALDNPGVMTPEIYEACTDDEEYDTQEKIQQHLQEIWDACFGNSSAESA